MKSQLEELLVRRRKVPEVKYTRVIVKCFFINVAQIPSKIEKNVLQSNFDISSHVLTFSQ